jgi:hypothetical protein
VSLLAAFTLVTAHLHLPTLSVPALVCDGEYHHILSTLATLIVTDEQGCVSALAGRALRGSSSANAEMTVVAAAATSSSDQIVTVTVETSTTVPCSSDQTDTGVSTTTLSQHSTTTDLITATRISTDR